MEQSWPKMIHHYTSISTLKAILRTKKIRFSTLANVNDKYEGETQDIGNLGKYIFVSCWTSNNVENNWMWKEYGDNCKGVKISLDFPPFKLYDDGKIPSIVPLNGVFCKDYLILPSRENYYNFIEYTNNENDLKPRTIYDYWAKGEFEYGKVGKCKESLYPWLWEDELRFIIYTLPKSKRYVFNGDPEHFIGDAISMMKNNFEINVSYIDLDILEQSFKNMTITLGSEIDPTEKENVTQIIKLFNPDSKITESKLRLNNCTNQH